MNIIKVVIPVAGFDARFIPIIKALPKGIIPVLDKPSIQYVVEEAVAAGIINILLITGRRKQAIERHFDKSQELEKEPKRSGKGDRLERVREITDLADIHYVSQRERTGLDNAVTHARNHVGAQPFALLLGDTIVNNEVPCTSMLIEYAEEHDRSVLSLERVSWEEVFSYGVGDVDETEPDQERILVSDFVEKPSRDEAPSNLVITGRYVLTPYMFDELAATTPGVGGELQLTDAIRELVREWADG